MNELFTVPETPSPRLRCKGAPRRKSLSAVKAALAMNLKPWICDACGWATDTLLAHCDECRAVRSSFHRRRIFSLSLGDWLDEEVPIEWLAEMLDTIRQCDQVFWILCTKRPELFYGHESPIYKQGRLEAVQIYALEQQNHPLHWWLCLWGNHQPPRNIILLTSVENQEQADIRIPDLMKIPAACRGLSLEPLLGPVDLKFRLTETTMGDTIKGIDWLIIGGESGPNARPCNLDWIRHLVAQGKAAGVDDYQTKLDRDQLLDRLRELWFVAAPPPTPAAGARMRV